jgi:hypothetical protein
MVLLNVVMLRGMLAETVKVKVAAATWFGVSTVLFWFQLSVIYCEAVVGDQPLAVILRVMLAVPVFFTQIG